MVNFMKVQFCDSLGHNNYGEFRVKNVNYKRIVDKFATKKIEKLILDNYFILGNLYYVQILCLEFLEIIYNVNLKSKL